MRQMKKSMPVLDAPKASDLKFITISEAAERLGISRNSVLRRLKAKRLEGYQDPTSHYHYVSERSVQATLRRLQALRAAAALPGEETLDERWAQPA